MGSRTFHIAVDLGAGSGRVFVGAFDSTALDVREVHRFHSTPRHLAGHLRWDAAAMFDGLRTGSRQAGDVCREAGELVSIGVDAWGVDYGLLDVDGHLLEDPICYRDSRTTEIVDEVFARVPREAIFAATGIQFLPFNTLFQLAAHVREGLPRRARQLLLIPDLCHHALCAALVSERTNASTTQLLNVTTGEWDEQLFARLDLPRALMPRVTAAGAVLGVLRPALQRELGLPPLRIIAPATHDTASAVAGIPLEGGWAYISSGTWSLVGVERDTPLVNDAVMRENFTNERGAQGTVRLLKNVMGLWILESCRREWRTDADSHDLNRLLARVAQRSGVNGLVFPDAPRFLNPRSMIGELQDALRETGQAAPDDPVVLAKIVLDSLALRYASILSTLESLTGQPIPGVHIAGGGARNDYLNQATANASGRPVRAGPVEAAALGNLLVQAAAHGSIPSIHAGRQLIAAALPPRRFDPQDGPTWREATRRYEAITN